MNKNENTPFLIFNSILGQIKLIGKSGYISGLQFTSEKTVQSGIGYLDDCKEQILAYLDGKLKKFSCKFILEGTDFQIKVWKTLTKIPYGQIITYKELAGKIGNSSAFRAVAMANAKNKIPLIVPCHRVIYSNGSLGGYSSGREIKRFLLKLETGKDFRL